MARLGRVTSIALIYIGTVVGAGFASGQETWFFFSFSGKGPMGDSYLPRPPRCFRRQSHGMGKKKRGAVLL